MCYLFSNCTFLASSLVNSVANRLGLSPSQAKVGRDLEHLQHFKCYLQKLARVVICQLASHASPQEKYGSKFWRACKCPKSVSLSTRLSPYSSLSLLVSLPTRVSPYSCLSLLVSLPTRVSSLSLLVSLPTRLSSYSSLFLLVSSYSSLSLLVSLPTRVSPYSCLFLLVSLPTRLSSYSSLSLLVSLPTHLSPYSSLFLLVSLPTRLSSYSSFSLLVSLPTRLSPYSSLSLPSLSLLVFEARVHFCPREDELEPIAVGKQRHLRDF